ncbi:hypothetical protein, partial [Emticicia sp. 17c]|uniref:hypothetical protein n=1 Tax=Emticicia sp. 17c TaxID=3127704 RepID=UPI00301CB35D
VLDTDGDGVTDDKDLCPNTASGTTVNAYGCPVSLTSCDYSSSSFSVSLVGAAPTETRYLLVNSQSGLIEQIATSPSFSGLTGSNTYMVLAYSYTGTPTGLTVGGQLSSLTASCQDFSNALMVKVCVPVVGNNCDYTTSSITLNIVGTAPANGVTKYVLVNTSGIIVKISDTPTFTGLSGVNDYYAYAISYTGTISNLSIGNNLSTVNGSCFDWSNPVPLKVCVCKSVCLPVLTTKIK